VCPGLRAWCRLLGDWCPTLQALDPDGLAPGEGH
jgi:hypothetical protein